MFLLSRRRIKTVATTTATVSVVWAGWFGHQVFFKNNSSAIAEVTLRAQEVARHFSTYTTTQLLAFHSLAEFLISLCKLLAPFVYDVCYWLRTLQKTLPIEVQVGTVSMLTLAYVLYRFRWARQIAFAFPAAGLFMLSRHIPEYYMLYYFVPFLSLYLPYLESVRVFLQRKNNHAVQQWLHYWALSPLTVYGTAWLQEKMIFELEERSERFGIGISSLELLREGNEPSLAATATRPLVLFLMYLVIWHSSDIVYQQVVGLLGLAAKHLLHFEHVNSLRKQTSALYKQIQPYLPDASLLALFESFGIKPPAILLSSEPSKSQDESDSLNPMAMVKKATEKANTVARNASYISSIMEKLKSKGNIALVLGGGGVALYFCYSLLASLSRALTSVWFLYEVATGADRKDRKKLAFAILFLFIESVFSNPWFLLPKFAINFLRIPILFVFNIFGSHILDFLLQTERLKKFSRSVLGGIAGNLLSPTTSDDSRELNSPRGRSKEGGKKGTSGSDSPRSSLGSSPSLPAQNVNVSGLTTRRNLLNELEEDQVGTEGVVGSEGTALEKLINVESATAQSSKSNTHSTTESVGACEIEKTKSAAIDNSQPQGSAGKMTSNLGKFMSDQGSSSQEPLKTKSPDIATKKIDPGDKEKVEELEAAELGFLANGKTTGDSDTESPSKVK